MLDGHPGVALTIGARFNSYLYVHEVVETIPDQAEVRVYSEHMDTKWVYVVAKDGTIEARGVKSKTGALDPNPFLEACVTTAARYLTAKSMPLWKTCSVALSMSRYFADEKSKMGLGSSACLATTFSAALLIAAGIDVTAASDAMSSFREGLMLVASVAHCHAQGKIDSGFDVSAAIHSNHLFTRVDKQTLEAGIEKLALAAKPLPTLEEIQNWKFPEPKSISAPGMRAVFIYDEKNVGAKTAGMVRKLVQWRENGNDEVKIVRVSTTSRNFDVRFVV